jgi:tRNA A-37 threonylcarbamoyl transferase component Bud32
MTPAHDDDDSPSAGTLRAARSSQTPDAAVAESNTEEQIERGANAALQAATNTWQASSAPSAPLQLPSRFGDYELVQELARGGMGVVYKARCLVLDRTVALKMILDDSLSSAEAAERFRREARAAAALDHPHIVAIHDIGVQDGRCYFTMAFVDGPSLKQSVRDHGPPAPHDAVRLLLAVADAVAFAHRHGVIHRDLKPENILLDAQGRPRVADFGLAKRCGPDDPALTASGQVIGTPAYMPPEQAAGEADKIGPHTDVYSLGGVLYFLLTGQPPFRGKSATQVLAQVMLGEPTPPRQLNPQAPAALEEICLQCLSKDPAKRPPSAAALAEALRAAPLPGASSDTMRLPGAEAAPATGPQSWRQSRTAVPTVKGKGKDKPGLAAAVAVVAVAALLAVGSWLTADRWAWWNRGGAPAPGPEPTPDPEPARAALVLPMPDKLRKDFGLKVTMLAGDADGKNMRPVEADADGVFRVGLRQKVQFQVTADRPAYVGVWSREANGKVYQLFPNTKDDRDRDHAFKANQTRIVPCVGAFPTESPDVDQLWIRAASDYWDPLQGDDEEHFRRFEAVRVEKGWQVRGLRLPEKDLSDDVVRYQVVK